MAKTELDIRTSFLLVSLPVFRLKKLLCSLTRKPAFPLSFASVYRSIAQSVASWIILPPIIRLSHLPDDHQTTNNDGSSAGLRRDGAVLRGADGPAAPRLRTGGQEALQGYHSLIISRLCRVDPKQLMFGSRTPWLTKSTVCLLDLEASIGPPSDLHLSCRIERIH